ncbi:MAG: protein kinase, partial [Armatimonadia bacterium]
MIGKTIGEFQIIREIGRGGMGIVYEAQQATPSRRVALKALPPQFASSADVSERFRSEAQKMATLDGHPGVVSVYAAGEDQGTAYFTMQLLSHGTLADHLARHAPFGLPFDEVAAIGAQLADALDFAHSRGIIHRDIKPANIMFSAQGQPVITDFGIAKAGDEVRVTLTGMAICTPEYASPEQFKGNPVDGRSDLYSLGVMLYQMVAGGLPFDAGSGLSMAVAHMERPPTPLSYRFGNIPSELERIILKCLAKDPSERYANAGQLAAELRALQLPHVQAAPRDVPYAMPQPTAVAPISTPAPTAYVTPGPAPIPKPRSKTGLLVLAILGALFLLGGGALMLINSGLIGPAKAPSLIGLSFDNARAALASGKAGFTLQQASDKQFNEMVPANMICRQDPAPGSRCQKGQPIVVTLSRGPAVKVPNLVGQTADTARSTLMSVGKLPIQVDPNPRYDSTTPAGQIMSQTPSAGTEVERGDAVRVVLSKGPEPEPVDVPSTSTPTTPPSNNWGWEHSDAPDEDIYRAVDSWIA